MAIARTLTSFIVVYLGFGLIYKTLCAFHLKLDLHEPISTVRYK